MGRDKALVPWRGGALIDAVAASLGAVSDELLLLTGSEPRYVGRVPGARVVLDTPTAHGSLGTTPGPLAGLAAALAAARCATLVTLPVDVPIVDAAALRALLALAAECGADAVFVRGPRGVEPLLAVYRVARCAPEATRLLASGERRPVALSRAVPSAEVDAAALAAAAGVDVEALLANVNAPGDLARLARLGGLGGLGGLARLDGAVEEGAA